MLDAKQQKKMSDEIGKLLNKYCALSKDSAGTVGNFAYWFTLISLSCAPCHNIAQNIILSHFYKAVTVFLENTHENEEAE